MSLVPIMVNSSDMLGKRMKSSLEGWGKVFFIGRNGDPVRSDFYHMRSHILSWCEQYEEARNFI